MLLVLCLLFVRLDSTRVELDAGCARFCNLHVPDCAGASFCTTEGFCSSLIRDGEEFQFVNGPFPAGVAPVTCEEAVSAKRRSVGDDQEGRRLRTRREFVRDDLPIRAALDEGPNALAMVAEDEADVDDEVAIEGESNIDASEGETNLDESEFSDNSEVESQLSDSSDIMSFLAQFQDPLYRFALWDAIPGGGDVRDALEDCLAQTAVLSRLPDFPEIAEDISDAIGDLGASVARILNMPIGPELSAMAATVSGVVAWKQAIGTMLAVVQNDAMLPSAAVDAAKLHALVYRDFMTRLNLFSTIEDELFNSILARPPAGRVTFSGSHWNAGCSFCAARRDPRNLAGEARDLAASLRRHRQSGIGYSVFLLEHVVDLLARFLTPNLDLDVEVAVCAAFAWEGAMFMHRFLDANERFAIFLRICAQHVSLDQGLVRQFLPLRTTIGVDTEYPIARIEVAQTRWDEGVPISEFSLQEAIRALRGFSKLDFVHPRSPRVTFTDSEALGEGPRNEWVATVVQLAFSPGNGFFEFSDENQNYVRPIRLERIPAHRQENFLISLRQVGRLVGLGMRDSLSLQIGLTPGCVALLTGVRLDRIPMDDLDEFWELEDPKHRDETCALRDSVEAVNGIGFPGPTDLRTLDETNVEDFIQATMDWRVFGSVKPQMEALLAGIHDVLPYGSLALYSARALAKALRGKTTIDLEDLQRSAGLFEDQTPKEVEYLWRILSGYSQAQLRMFVKFVSGSSFPPVNGFTGINGTGSWLQITMDSSILNDSYPQTQTCFHQLKLPEYSSIRIMAERLGEAILQPQSTDRT